MSFCGGVHSGVRALARPTRTVRGVRVRDASETCPDTRPHERDEHVFGGATAVLRTRPNSTPKTVFYSSERVFMMRALEK